MWHPGLILTGPLEVNPVSQVQQLLVCLVLHIRSYLNRLALMIGSLVSSMACSSSFHSMHIAHSLQHWALVASSVSSDTDPISRSISRNAWYTNGSNIRAPLHKAMHAGQAMSMCIQSGEA